MSGPACVEQDVGTTHCRHTRHDVTRPWVAQDRDQWCALEATFVAKVLRSSPQPHLPKTRWMMRSGAETITARKGLMNCLCFQFV